MAVRTEVAASAKPLGPMETCATDLDVLAAIANSLSARSNPQQGLRSVLDSLEHGLGVLRGTIMLLMPEGKELVVEAAAELGAHASPAVRYQSGDGIIGRVVQTGLPAVVPCIADEPLFQNRIHQRDHGECGESAFLCVPIRLDNEVIGTLSVDLPRQSPESLRDRVRTLEITATMIAYDVRSRQAERLRVQSLESENLRLRDALQEQFRPENIVGNSHRMREVYRQIYQVAPCETTVLVRGESGTGKELVASALHYRSARARGPFVKVNCAALNDNLLESELFGHEKGAFTGAFNSRIGRIEEADGGTLFLDEIGEFSPALQVKLLRFLQERQFERVGSNRELEADVRIIAATHQNLEARVAEGVFRQDLYYRIHVFPITLPPLRERREDILQLADHFVAKYAKRMSKEIRRISTPAINMLFAYHWPGNVRELENCIEYAVLLANEGVIHGHHLPPTLQMPLENEGIKLGSLRAQTEALERDLITDAMKSCRGRIREASERLDITPRMLRYKIKKLRITTRQFHDRSSS